MQQIVPTAPIHDPSVTVAPVETASVLGGYRGGERTLTIVKGQESAGSRVILRWLTLSRPVLPRGERPTHSECFSGVCLV
jgi:hypothetical protein